MKFKNLFKSILTYNPMQTYNFSIIENENNDVKYANSEESNPKNVLSSINDNLDYMKSKYNTLINSDVVIRKFTLNARGKQYSAFILYIDGMVDSEIMDNFVLKPLMMRNKNNLYDGSQNKVVTETVTNNVTVRKIKKFDLANYIMNCLLPQNSVKQITEFEKIASGINSGNCALFVDTLSLAFDVDLKGFQQRSIDKPNNEIVIKGPHEAFVENIRTNTSMVRRYVNNENLVIENTEVGEITKTKCAIFYLDNITNEDLIAEVKYRINNLSVDSLLSAGQLEQLISEENNIGAPQVISTERPDKAVDYLLNGRVLVIVNGSPYALIMPVVLSDFLTSPDDKNLKVIFANFLKGLRFLGAFLSLLLPGLYIAITSFHQEILPTELLYSMLASRENVPFPVIVELLLLEISFELIREAGLRVPSPIGPTIGIVGALILGQAAVSAGIVSPILIIVVAITAIASFVIPEYSFGFHLRIMRFVFILLGYMSGFLGIALGFFVYMCILTENKSFGVSYLAGVSPLEDIRGNSYYLPPIWKREYRASFLKSKKPEKQNKISMNWKYK